MATRRPLVQIGGTVQELPAGDSTPGVGVPIPALDGTILMGLGGAFVEVLPITTLTDGWLVNNDGNLIATEV